MLFLNAIKIEDMNIVQKTASQFQRARYVQLPLCLNRLHNHMHVTEATEAAVAVRKLS
jgi:hypothetical protein